MIKGMKEVIEESRHLGGWNETYLQLVYNKLIQPFITGLNDKKTNKLTE
ncbi:hypothetical protein [Enterococcus cecorum]|nr:hypothetical protein [Enterococcus cecorum]